MNLVDLLPELLRFISRHSATLPTRLRLRETCRTLRDNDSPALSVLLDSAEIVEAYTWLPEHHVTLLPIGRRVREEAWNAMQDVPILHQATEREHVLFFHRYDEERLEATFRIRWLHPDRAVSLSLRLIVTERGVESRTITIGNTIWTRMEVYDSWHAFQTRARCNPLWPYE